MTDRETGWGWLYFMLQLFILPQLLNRLNRLLPSPLSPAWINFLLYSGNFAAVLVIFRGFLAKSLTQLGKRFFDCLKAVILGFVACWLCNQLLGLLIGWLKPGFSNLNDGSVAALAGTNFVITAIGTVLLVPIAEELFYRGLIFQGMYNRSKKAAYILSVLAFAAVHVVGFVDLYDPLTLVLCFIQYIPAALCLAWAYAESGCILAPILIHTVINAMGIYAVR